MNEEVVTEKHGELLKNLSKKPFISGYQAV